MKTIRQTITSLRKQSYYSYRLKDFFALFFILILWYTLHLLFQQLTLLPRFITSFLLMGFMTAFAAFLVRKFLAVLFMLLASHFLTGSLPDLSSLGTIAYLTLFFSGILFELLYLFLYMETHLVPFDVIFSLSLSFASLPLFALFFTSFSILQTQLLNLVNLVILDFFLALFATGFAFLLWYHLRTHPLFVRFEYAN